MSIIWREIKWMKDLITKAAVAAINGIFFLLDTETTGLHSDDEIVQFTIIKVGYKDGKFYAADTLDEYIKPSKPIPKEASDINHITNELLADKPTAREVFPKIKAFFGDAPAIGAYNLPFDKRMIESFYAQNGEVFTPSLEMDLLKFARNILCEQKMKDHKLATICDYYGVDDEVTEYHSSLEDTKVLVKLLNAMVEDIKENGVEPGQVPMRNVQLYKLNFWPGYRGNSRLYAITSGGSLYYDMKNDKWFSNTQSLDISTVNMDDLESQVFEMASYDSRWQSAPNARDYKELRRICQNGAFCDEEAS